MGCKLYIDKYTSTTEARDVLYKTHDELESRLENSGLFTKRGQDYVLPSENTIRNDRAKEYIKSINNDIGTPVIGIEREGEDEIAFVNVKNLAPQVEADIERAQLEGTPYEGAEVPQDALRTLNNLSAKFNLKWKVDNKQSTLGRFQNGTVYINTKKLKEDTPFHEFAHPFEQAIKQKNIALWNSLAQRASEFQINGRSIENMVSVNYPELTGDDLKSEVIVTAIGLAASNAEGFSEPQEARSFLSTIFAYLKNMLGLTVGNLNANTTIRELGDMMRSEKKINIAGTKFSTAEQKQSFVNTGDNIEKLKSLNPNVEVTQDQKNYKDSNGNLYDRATNWVTENFSSTKRKEKFAQKDIEVWAADKYYEQRRVPFTQKVTWEETGEEVDYQQLVALMKQQFEDDKKRGTIIHSIIENFITPTEESKKKLKDLYDNTTFERKNFKWISKEFVTKMLVNDLKLNVGENFEGSLHADVVKSEVAIASKLLGIGTTIDLIVNHSNGALSLFDFKSGDGLLKDINSVENMKFGELLNDIVKDNRLNKAKMELMLRALIIKEQMPEARFRDLSIVHIGKGRPTTKYDVSMHSYLEILKDYFEKEKPEVFTEMNKQGLFNIDNYTASSKELEESLKSVKYKNKTHAEQAQMLAAEMAQTRAKFELAGKKIPTYVEEQLRKKAQAVLELSGLSKSEILSDTLDMSSLEKMFGAMYEVANPTVQEFLKYSRKQDLEMKAKLARITNEQKRLLKAVKKEYRYDKTGNFLGYNPLKYKDYAASSTEVGGGLFDFMWEHKEVGDMKARYRRIITEDDVRNGRFTQAQYEYNKWYGDTLKELYSIMDEKSAGGKTHRQIVGAEKYYDEFMPRTPMLEDEVSEKYGMFSKQNAKVVFSDLNRAFKEEQYNGLKNNSAGIPIKFLGSKGILSSDNYSKNTEHMMLQFASNMLSKQYMDPVYALGKGVSSLLEETMGETQENTIEWLDSFLDGVIRPKEKDATIVRKGKNILGLDNKKMNWFLKTWNSIVTTSAMAFSFTAGAANMFLALSMNARDAISGSLMKRLHDIDGAYTVSDLAFGMKEWVKYVVASFKDPSGTNSKMSRFVELLNFSTEHYSQVNKAALLSQKRGLWNKNHLFFFHKVGEQLAMYSAMSAMLKHKKVTNHEGQYVKLTKQSDGSYKEEVVANRDEATSFWDAYEVTDTGEFKYIGPSRGYTKDGVKRMGLDSNEITVMQRVTQRVNGNYRPHEKAAIENMAMGSWMMKFKKHLPAIWANNFQTSFDDWTIGGYEKVVDENGQPVLNEGETVYQWEKRLNSSMVETAMKFVWYIMAGHFKEDSKLNPYRWGNMTEEQKKQIYRIAIGMTLSLVPLLLKGMWFPDDDDDDKKDPMYKRLTRLNEDLFQLYPSDLARTFSSPMIQGQMLYKMTEAADKFLFDGLGRGELIESGENAGRYPGGAYLRHKMPIINVYYGLKEGTDEDTFIGENLQDFLR